MLIDPRFQGLQPFNPALAPQPVDVAPPAEAPFVWGGGGQRLSPDDIERKRKMAEAQVAGGMDYSPVGSWTQGLARVAQGILGGLQERKLDKASAANDAETSDVIAKLLAPGGGAGTAPLAVLANPNLGSGAKSIAELLYKQNNPVVRAPGADEDLLLAQGLVPGTPQYQAAAKALFDRKSDPIVTVSTPIGLYSGPQSQLGQFMGGGGQSSGAPAGPAPPSTLPPDFDFGAAPAPTGNMGIPPNAVSPGGSTPTVLSRADAAPFMKSLGPAGFQRWMATRNIRLGN